MRAAPGSLSRGRGRAGPREKGLAPGSARSLSRSRGRGDEGSESGVEWVAESSKRRWAWIDPLAARTAGRLAGWLHHSGSAVRGLRTDGAPTIHCTPLSAPFLPRHHYARRPDPRSPGDPSASSLSAARAQGVSHSQGLAIHFSLPAGRGSSVGRPAGNIPTSIPSWCAARV